MCDRIALCIHEAFNAASDLTLFTATSFNQTIDALLLGTHKYRKEASAKSCMDALRSCIIRMNCLASLY